MLFAKCLDISQVPPPQSEADVPKVIWVASGELYVDLLISGKLERIKISDIRTRRALPDNPATGVLYIHNNRYKYHVVGDGWKTIATVDELEKVKNDLADMDARLTEVEQTIGGVLTRMENL